MSWLSNLFERNGKSSTANQGTPLPEIPEDVFIEKTAYNGESEKKQENEPAHDNIHMVYSFLAKDYQQLGYDDALVNPDISYKTEKVREIQGELDLVIRRAKTFYEDAMRELEFLIMSRNRSGMVDVVDELKMKKEKAKDHYEKIIELGKEATEQGETHRLVISYNRGFQNGMAAIAIHESGKKSF